MVCCEMCDQFWLKFCWIKLIEFPVLCFLGIRESSVEEPPPCKNVKFCGYKRNISMVKCSYELTKRKTLVIIFFCQTILTFNSWKTL